jgi:hypothetical protein
MESMAVFLVHKHIKNFHNNLQKSRNQNLQVEKTQAIPGFELGFQESESCVLTNYTISPLPAACLHF